MSRFAFDRAPLRVYWETTRACDLACRHCRAEAVPDADPAELTTADGLRLLERLLAFGEPLPHLVLTGGDPLKRGDLFELIDRARSLGLGVSVAPSATPLLTPDAVRRFKAAGVDAISLSLDGSTPERHDAIRGIPGTFARTLAAAEVARTTALAFQVNTLVAEETVDDLRAVYDRVVAMGAARWSLFFLVAVGRGQVLQPIAPERAERVLAWAAALGAPGGARSPVVTTTEAPQFRRVVAQGRRAAPGGPPSGGPGPVGHGAGIRDGNGIMFISHTGEICPSGFLEHSAGNTRTADLVAVYRESALFQLLRRPDDFAGRCGRCEFRWPCGGSRARAYAACGNPLGEDPLCGYVPALADPGVADPSGTAPRQPAS